MPLARGNMSSGLLDLLPIELIERILIYLSGPDLTAASCLNGSIYKIIKDSVEIQYSLALEMHGMIDGDESKSVRDKLAELLRREEAWTTLDLSRRVSVKVSHNPSQIYDLSGGVYLLGDCGQATDLRDTKSLRFYDLTSCRNGPVMREDTWRKMSIPDSIVDVGFAIQEHDLLGIIGVRKLERSKEDEIILHLRQFSSGLPHPYASRPAVLVGRAEKSWRKLSIMMEIVGPCLMLLLSWPLSQVESSIDVLLLVNWWTGEIVIREEAPSRTYDGFVFLTPDLVLLPNSSAGTFEVLQLPDLTNLGNTSPNAFKRIARLGLPRMNLNFGIFNVTCRAEPNPFGAPHPRRGDVREWQSSHKRPFSADPCRALVLAHILIRESDLREGPQPHWRLRWHRLNLVFHRYAIVDVIRAQGTSQAGENEGEEDELIIDIPWNEWASGNVRVWAGDEEHSVWITTTAGQRFAGLDSDGRLVVKNFNQYAVKRMRAAFEAGELQLNEFTFAELFHPHERTSDDHKCLMTVFSTDDIGFKELPFIETVSDSSRQDIKFDSVLMDEERIIGLFQDEEQDEVVKFDVISM